MSEGHRWLINFHIHLEPRFAGPAVTLRKEIRMGFPPSKGWEMRIHGRHFEIDAVCLDADEGRFEVGLTGAGFSGAIAFRDLLAARLAEGYEQHQAEIDLESLDRHIRDGLRSGRGRAG